MVRVANGLEAGVIRVLHVVGGLGVGGTETWLAKGLAAIDRTRYQFDFLVHGDGPQPYRERIEEAGGRVLICPGPRRFPLYAAALFRILREGGYRALHAHTHASSGFALAIAAAAGVPVRVFHSHTAEDASGGTKWKAAYFRGARYLIQRYATRGIAVSEEAARPFFPADWRQKGPHWRVSPIGIDLAAFATGEERGEVREELKISPGTIAVVHVGRFAEVKNHELLVEIALELAMGDREIVIVLVGDGERRRFIEREVESWGLSARFRMLGVRNDVERILKACDVFVLPSRYEGYPLAYVEAQAAGLPCVISDVVAQAADLVPRRTTRLAVTAEPRVWADAIRTASGTRRPKMVPRQLRSVAIEASMEHMVESYY